MLPRILPALLCTLLWTASAAAQDKVDANIATLQKARELSSLHQPGTPPYRLQASFETYDYKGEPDGKGILTETYLHDWLWQRRILYRDKHSVVTWAEGKLRTVSDPGFQTSFALGHVIDDLFAPIPAQDSLKQYRFASTPTKAGTLSLNCVVGSLPYRSADADAHPGMVLANRDPTSAPNLAYCVDKDTTLVRLIEGRNGVGFAFNRILHFGSVYVPGDITMTEKGKMRAHLHIDALAAATNLSENDIALPPADVGGSQQVDGSAIPGHKLGGAVPRYPEDAKQRHIQGIVVLHAIITADGHIRDLELVSAPDDSLVDSAMEAVRTWTYSPFLMNGVPTEVETGITVNYSFGGR